MKSLADQDLRDLGGRLSVLARQKSDHARLDRMLDELSSARGEAEQELLNRICRLVFSHAFAEEAVLWPAVRAALPDGDELTSRVEEEHQAINELMVALESSRPGDAGRPELIQRFAALLRQDVRDEEDELLPRLQEAVTPGRLRRLGAAWEAVRRSAPTRAHPLVARRPPGNVASALPLSAIDRSRDGLDAAARRTSGILRLTLADASELLGGLAARVEQTPCLRRGGRLETHHTDEPAS